MKTNPHSIEPLESRIAPSTVLTFVNANSAAYDDVDGDRVTVKFSKPILTSGNVGTVLHTVASGLGLQLQFIDLTGLAAAPDGTGITITAALQDIDHNGSKDGDGFVNVGQINATAHDLGAVSIKGDLGRIDAGDATTTTPASPR